MGVSAGSGSVLGSSRYRGKVVGPASLWQEAVVPGCKALGHAEASEDTGWIFFGAEFSLALPPSSLSR